MFHAAFAEVVRDQEHAERHQKEDQAGERARGEQVQFRDERAEDDHVDDAEPDRPTERADLR